jgi:hypothetical protein
MLPFRSVCSKERREWLREPHSVETVGEATGGLPGTWAPLRCPGEAPTLWVAPECSNETRKGEKLCPLQFAPRTMCLRSRQWHSHVSDALRRWERAANRPVCCQTRLQTFTSSTICWDQRRWKGHEAAEHCWMTHCVVVFPRQILCESSPHEGEQVPLASSCYTSITRYSRCH